MALLGLLDKIPNKDQLTLWCLKRQIGGLNGRPEKDQDTCYSYWVGSTLATLGALHYLDFDACIDFTMCCQSDYGGIAKVPNAYPDLMHSYLSLCGLSLMGFEGLNPIDPTLGVTLRALGKN